VASVAVKAVALVVKVASVAVKAVALVVKVALTTTNKMAVMTIQITTVNRINSPKKNWAVSQFFYVNRPYKK
jgi:hypothetical protein